MLNLGRFHFRLNLWLGLGFYLSGFYNHGLGCSYADGNRNRFPAEDDALRTKRAELRVYGAMNHEEPFLYREFAAAQETFE